MGTARSNLLNQLKGSFGNVILYEVNGQLRIRSKTGRYRKSKSSKQKAQKNRFKGAASFYHKLEMPMYMTWSDATHGQNISGYNLFIKENIHSFTETGEITEFSGLKICYGAALYPGLFRNAIYHSGSYSPGNGIPGIKIRVSTTTYYK